MLDVDTSNPAYRHGHAGKRGFSPTYYSWASMVQRCTNANVQGYKHYGARGVRVHEPWLKFEAFLADMGVRPEGTSLDRVDVYGGYCPGNCRWASKAQQANNKRSNVVVECNGEFRTISQWCDELGVSRNTMWARINKYKLSPLEALLLGKRTRAESAMVASLIKSKFSGKEG